FPHTRFGRHRHLHPLPTRRSSDLPTCSPFKATGSPLTKSIVTVCGSDEVTGVGQAVSGRYLFEVSVSAPPTDVPHNPLLIEYFAFSALISTPCLATSAISSSVDNLRPRIGVIISTPGLSVIKIISNRT